MGVASINAIFTESIFFFLVMAPKFKFTSTKIMSLVYRATSVSCSEKWTSQWRLPVLSSCTISESSTKLTFRFGFKIAKFIEIQNSSGFYLDWQ